MLPVHIFSALSSLIYAGLVVLRPSRRRIKLSYALIGLTTASGIALIICEQGHILSSCLTGLIYLGISNLATVTAWRKLAKQKI